MFFRIYYCKIEIFRKECQEPSIFITATGWANLSAYGTPDGKFYVY